METTLLIVAYMLMVYGCTNILVNGDGPFGVVLWMRKLLGTISVNMRKMLSCMMCTSTNVGIVLSVLDVFLTGVSFTPFNLLLPNSYWWLIIPFDAFLSSGVTWIINAIELWFEDKSMYVDLTTSDNED